MAGTSDPKDSDTKGGILARNPGPVIAAAVSLVGLALGYLQFHLSEQRSADETARERDRLDQQRMVENARADQEWKLALTQFATENHDEIFAEDEAKRARLRALMNATFPPELLKGFYEEQSKSATTFAQVAVLSQAYAAVSGQQQQQQQPLPPPPLPAPADAAPDAPASDGSAVTQPQSPAQVPRVAQQATIYLQYGDSRDLAAVEGFMDELRAEGFRTPGRELVEKFEVMADVRYFHAADRADAERPLAALTALLRRHGRSAPAAPKDLSQSYRNVPEGVVEVWVPRLGG